MLPSHRVSREMYCEGRGRLDLKRLLQEADIPPWQRDQLRVARMHDGTVAGLWHPSRGWWLLAVLTQQ